MPPACLVCLGLLAGPALAPTQADDHPLSPPVLEITTMARVVDVFATVKDTEGRLITSLPREEFELLEDGVPQDVAYFSHQTDAPLSLGLLIDTSASQAQLLPAEREKAREFLDAVLGPSDRAFVMHFDREIEVLQELTGDALRLSAALEAVRGDSGSAPGESSDGRTAGTRLYDAMHRASTALQGEKGRKVIVVVTDGEDQGSRVGREAALEATERAEVIVYSVLVANPVFYWIRNRAFEGEAALETFHRRTGGLMVHPEATGGFERIASELRSQYRLGYTPRRPRYDGSFRRITVRLRDGGYSVRARRGYYATAE